MGHVAAAVVLVLLAAPGLLPAAATPVTSEYWGKRGELWSPSGPIMDFSFAGYRQSNIPLPHPPVTKSVMEFKEKGMTDTEALIAAIKWANKLPSSDEFVVLSLPEGEFVLDQRIYIRRSRLILRGAGSDKTILRVPKSMTDLYGPSPGIEDGGTGGYIYWGGFITFKGHLELQTVTQVTSTNQRGDTRLKVDDASQLNVGQFYVLRWEDNGGEFVNSVFDYLLPAPEKHFDKSSFLLTARIVEIQGNWVTFERPIPYAIWEQGARVTISERWASVADSGVEGLTFAFKWEKYNGHHLEKGWNALEFNNVVDCWARDIHTVNADSAVVMTDAFAVTIRGLELTITESRVNPDIEFGGFDGHWGVHHTQSYDILVDGFKIHPVMYHSVGAGSAGMFSVFMNGWMADGNLEIHRALAGPLLFTNINVGVGSKALYSGGPISNGPNTQSNSTYWNIRSNDPILPPDNNGKESPGDCNYGSHLNLIGVNIDKSQARRMCSNWRYEPGVNYPQNLFEAQLERRLGGNPSKDAAAARKQHLVW